MADYFDDLPQTGVIQLEKFTTYGDVTQSHKDNLSSIVSNALAEAMTSEGTYKLQMGRRKLVLTVELPKPLKAGHLGHKKKVL